MRILLVLHKYGIPLGDPCCYPLGFMYVSAVLKRAGYDVKVLNYNLFDYDLTTEIQDKDAVLFTGFEEFLPHIKRDAAMCKQHGVKTILGGALATFKSKEMLQYVDTVIIGEGEAVIEQALTDRGVIQGGRVDINSLPYPDYEEFGVREYHKRNGVKHMGVLTSRGCPWTCRFCAQTCNFQYRGIDGIFKEIDHYQDMYSINMLVFNDNTFNISKIRFMQMCDGMTGRDLAWAAAIRVSGFDEEMAQAAKKSGCRYFVVGIESFDQTKLDRMNKKIKVSDIYKTLDLLHKYKIGYHGNVLTGLPGETKQNIFNEVTSLPDGYNVFPVLVQPFIGTEYQTRDIDKETEKLFADSFKSMIESRGMFQYPSAVQ